jgi:hypothetical protein
MPSLKPGRARPRLAFVVLRRILSALRVILVIAFTVLIRALAGNRVVPPPPPRNLPSEIERRG